ncbi:TetR family transcriptional regulator [Rhodococcus kronopolitis]|uniref:TetR family transcriptional regulator n=1 Tax=Rhodococcus kronopolitis TaxID=1460226 RepID=A0ABV9FXK2_9NOCA
MSAGTAPAGTATAGGRSGRRPGSPATRDHILSAARSRFAEHGFDRTSVRSIAAAAEVDPALVHHYFRTKRELFLTAVAIPVDPQVVLAALRDAPTDELGERLLRVVLSLWDSPQGEALLAAFRTAVAGESEGLIGAFVTEVVLSEIAGRVDTPPGTAALRTGLVATQMSGVILSRYLLRIEPVAGLPVDRLVRLVGPVLQHYLTGDLDDRAR